MFGVVQWPHRTSSPKHSNGQRQVIRRTRPRSAPGSTKASAQPTMTPSSPILGGLGRDTLRPAPDSNGRRGSPAPGNRAPSPRRVCSWPARPVAPESACAGAIRSIAPSWARNCRIHGRAGRRSPPAAPVSVQGRQYLSSIEPEPVRYITSRVPIRRTRCPVTPERADPSARRHSAGSAARVLVVSRSLQDGTYRYTSRLDRDASGWRRAAGYLFVSPSCFGRIGETAISEQRVPESWLVTQRDGSGACCTRRETRCRSS